MTAQRDTGLQRGAPAARTQEQRSAATRKALIEATLDLLAEVGYGRATTGEIAARAGVSRGALMHHFTSKEDLVAVAVEHKLHDATRTIQGWLEQVRAGTLSFDGFLEHLWTLYSGPLLFVTIEHITEARHNETLRTSLVPVVREFHAALDTTWRAFFRSSALDDDEIEVTLNMTTSLFRGLGIQTVLRRDPAYYRKQVDRWKDHLRGLLHS